jgi:hypothetical protein
MQGTVLAETEAFITRQREQLLQQRQELVSQQEALQQQLDELDEMLRKFDVFEGKTARPRQQTRSRRTSKTRRGSKRDELLKVIRAGNGLTRGKILQNGLEGQQSRRDVGVQRADRANQGQPGHPTRLEIRRWLIG